MKKKIKCKICVHCDIKLELFTKICFKYTKVQFNKMKNTFHLKTFNRLYIL